VCSSFHQCHPSQFGNNFSISKAGERVESHARSPDMLNACRVIFLAILEIVMSSVNIVTLAPGPKNRYPKNRKVDNTRTCEEPVVTWYLDDFVLPKLTLHTLDSILDRATLFRRKLYSKRPPLVGSAAERRFGKTSYRYWILAGCEATRQLRYAAGRARECGWTTGS
jgi:hypothetical protein